jgi:hypothetical protein
MTADDDNPEDAYMARYAREELGPTPEQRSTT